MPPVIRVGTAAAWQRIESVRRRPTKRFPWSHRTKYRHTRDGHTLTLFSDRAGYGPSILVKLHAAPGTLLALREALHHCSAINAALHLGHLLPSSIELASDFHLDPTVFMGMRAFLYRARGKRWTEGSDRKGYASIYLGRRKAARQSRWYWKTEKHRPDIPDCARLEHVLKRKALRALGVQTLGDLLTVNWPEVISQQARFLELDCTRTRGRDPFVLDCLPEWCGVAGLQILIQRGSRSHRRWMRRHLKKLPVQRHIEEAWTHCTERTPGPEWPK